MCVYKNAAADLTVCACVRALMISVQMMCLADYKSLISLFFKTLYIFCVLHFISSNDQIYQMSVHVNVAVFLSWSLVTTLKNEER